jgi:galactose-6-phosphate isomerase
MAQIDVSELLHDPDFVDEMQIASRVPAVNSFGENILSETILASIGSVQPASSETLQRLPEALRSANVKSFWVQGPIKTLGPGVYPDILIFKGARFQVQSVDDWTNWGAGWTQGTCVAEALA